MAKCSRRLVFVLLLCGQAHAFLVRFLAIRAGLANITHRVLKLDFHDSSLNALGLAEMLTDAIREFKEATDSRGRFSDVVLSAHYDSTNMNPAAFKALGAVATKNVLGVVRRRNRGLIAGRGRGCSVLTLALLFLVLAGLLLSLACQRWQAGPNACAVVRLVARGADYGAQPYRTKCLAPSIWVLLPAPRQHQVEKLRD